MIRHSRIGDILYFAGFACSVAALLVAQSVRKTSRVVFIDEDVPGESVYAVMHEADPRKYPRLLLIGSAVAMAPLRSPGH